MTRIFILVSLLLPGFVSAEAVGEVVEYGYYATLKDLSRKRNLATTSGYSREGGEVALVKSTQQIPIEKGRLFGIKYRIKNLYDTANVQLNMVVSHPEMTRPNGSTSLGYSYPVYLDVKDGVAESHIGYSLDNDFELVEGDWRFDVYYKNEVIVSQTFQTVAISKE